MAENLAEVSEKPLGLLRKIHMGPLNTEKD